MAESDESTQSSFQFGPGFGPTFLYYFAGTALLFSLITAKSMGLSVTSGLPQQVGLLGGLLAGSVGGYFNRTIAVSLEGKKAKVTQLETLLSQIGYQSVETVEDVKVYQRSGLSRLLSGRIFVQTEGTNVTLAGRSSQIKAIQKALQ